MINQVLPILIFATIAIGMPAGLFTSIFINLFNIILLGCITFYNKNNLQFIYKHRILEIVFLSLCLISITWSINTEISINTMVTITVIFLINCIIHDNIQLSYINTTRLQNSILLSLIIAIIIFTTEKLSNGLLSRIFRSIFQNDKPVTFYLYMLDRGCCLLGLTSWLVIAKFMVDKRYYASGILYAVVMYLLLNSDSLANILAYISSALTFLSIFIFYNMQNLRYLLLKLIKFSVIIVAIATPFIAYNINPESLAKKYDNVIQDSAIHRLYIWHFIGHKILEEPILGHGLNASKTLSKNNTDNYVDIKQYHWSLIPMHPHNSTLQILLELGIAGFLLMLMLLYKWFSILEKHNKDDKFFVLSSYTCFIHYFIISMISYNIWQTWWLSTGFWIFLMIKILSLKRSE